MNYMGGKHRQGPKIAEFVTRALKPGMSYYEPFCGAMGVAYRVIPAAAKAGLEIPIIGLSDVNESVITMWRRALGGWVPPDVVSEETYRAVKSVRDPSDPMTAYCGFGMSFGSKWFGGYARNGSGRRFAINASRSTLLKASVLLKACDYREVKPSNAVIYLDPPYAGRTKAHGVDFDHGPFWEYASDPVGLGNAVLVTEFTAPEGWAAIHSFGDTVVRHKDSKGKDGTVESIYVHESQLGLFDDGTA